MSGTLVDLSPARPVRHVRRSWLARQYRFASEEIKSHPWRIAVLSAMAGTIIAVGYVLGTPVVLDGPPRPPSASPSATATAAHHGTPARRPPARPVPRRAPARPARPAPAPVAVPVEPRPATTRSAASTRPSAGPTSSSALPVVTRTFTPSPSCPPTGCV